VLAGVLERVCAGMLEVNVTRPGSWQSVPALARIAAPLLGRRYVLDMRLEQEYLRSQQVNSEEGAPIGIGIW
jgi:hypothetical protein